MIDRKRLTPEERTEREERHSQSQHARTHPASFRSRCALCAAEDESIARRQKEITSAAGDESDDEGEDEHNPRVTCPKCGHTAPGMDGFSALGVGLNGIEAGDADDFSSRGINALECGNCSAWFDVDTGEVLKPKAEELRAQVIEITGGGYPLEVTTDADLTLWRVGESDEYTDGETRVSLGSFAESFSFPDVETPCPFCSELKDPDAPATTDADRCIAIRFPKRDECARVVAMVGCVYYSPEKGYLLLGHRCDNCGAC